MWWCLRGDGMVVVLVIDGGSASVRQFGTSVIDVACQLPATRQRHVIPPFLHLRLHRITASHRWDCRHASIPCLHCFNFGGQAWGTFCPQIGANASEVRRQQSHMPHANTSKTFATTPNPFPFLSNSHTTSTPRKEIRSRSGPMAAPGFPSTTSFNNALCGKQSLHSSLFTRLSLYMDSRNWTDYFSFPSLITFP
jgi:hypothetical protein